MPRGSTFWVEKNNTVRDKNCHQKMNRGITYDLAIEPFAEDFIGPREPPNAIEILIEVMNDANFDVLSRTNKILLYRAAHEYRHIKDHDPDHNWLANFKFLEQRSTGKIKMPLVYEKYWSHPDDGCRTWYCDHPDSVIRYMMPSNGYCTNEKEMRWGNRRIRLLGDEDDERDIEESKSYEIVPGFSCDFVLGPGHHQICPKTCYWFYKKLEQLSYDVPFQPRINGPFIEEFPLPLLLRNGKLRLGQINN